MIKDPATEKKNIYMAFISYKSECGFDRCGNGKR